MRANRGEVVRFYLTNTANTRVFNVALPGALMKLVGGDSGRQEREQFVDSLVLAPSERAVVDVLFGEPGRHTLGDRTPERTHTLSRGTGRLRMPDAPGRRQRQARRCLRQSDREAGQG